MNATADAIRPEHFTSILPHPLVALLRTNANESGYRHVHRKCPGSDQWRAKVKIRGVLTQLKGSSSLYPHQAALHVVVWFQERFGPHWKIVMRQRRGVTPPFRVWQQKATRLVRVRIGPRVVLRACRGWCARVWEHGRPVELTGVRKSRRCADPFDTLRNCRLCRTDWRHPRRLLVFATKKEAKLAVQRWIQLRWGDKAKEVVWRW